MSRQIAAENVQREDSYRVPPSQVVVDHTLNTRLYEPDVTDLYDEFKEIGQNTPCIGKTLPDKRIMLIAGYRRWLAGKRLEDKQASEGIPVEDRFKLRITLQKNVSADMAFDINVGENAKRKSLSPPEIAHVIRRYRETRGWIDAAGTAKIAKMLGCSTATITETEKLLQLSEEHLHQVHLYYTTKEKEGLSLPNAKLLIQIPEGEREALLEAAREATAIQEQVNEPPVVFPAKPTTKSEKTKANAAISSRTLANVAAANGNTDIKLKARTTRDVVAMYDEILAEERATPYHSDVIKMLERMRRYFLSDPAVTAPMVDNSIDKVAMLVAQATNTAKATA